MSFYRARSLLSLSFSTIPSLRMSFSATSLQPQKDAHCSRYLFRQPSPAASRESPWPVVFLRAKGLGEEPGEWADWSGMFAEKGYTAIEIDITAPTPLPESESPFGQMSNSLSSQIRLSAIPFPPIIIARGLSTLLAQTFISDFPASGLVLVDPVPDDDPRPTGFGTTLDGSSKGLAWAWPKFTFEPHFPILLISSQPQLNKLSISNRLLRTHAGVDPNSKSWLGRMGSGGGKGVEVVAADGLEGGELGEGARVEVERWMDRCGF
ncbi:hypothetical protein IAR50_006253 [Cryptococcus sp. DSM 104548]